MKEQSSLERFLLALLILQTIAFRATAADLLRLEANADAMGSTYSVVLYGEDRSKLEAAAESAFDEARRLDTMLSNYKSDSEWSIVNAEASNHPVVVSQELFDLLSACVDYSRRSEGSFDITVGPLMKVWGFYKGSGHLPKPGEVEQALKQFGYGNIVLNASDRTVFFKKAGLNIDPGGVGKGYAVDRMVAVLRKQGIQAALVSGGGSSIYCIGAPPDEPGWRIEIKDPRDEFKRATEVVLKDESLSTSGSYEKFFVAEGKTWSHIMDPRTGYPARGTLSVSIVSPLTLDSEVWAKPYFILGRQWTSDHKPRNFRVFYCEDKVDQPCAWLQ